MEQKQNAPEELTEGVENIEHMMVVIGVKSSLALGAVLLAFTASVLWGFWGTMQVREEVSGVLVKSGTIINIYANDDGILLDFVPLRGMFVEQDQALARIERIELVEEINRLLDTGSEEELIEAQRNLLLNKSRITAWESGRVVDIYVHRGDYVRQGQRLLTISKEAPASTALECLLFVPAEQMRNIKKGLPVSVYPASVSRKIHGNMIGTVSIIGEYPVTEQYLYDRLNSEDLGRFFLRDSACYEIYITLVSSEETVTGYEWTTSLGPSKAFGDLTLCTASVVIDELRPIDVFFLGK
ncbi:MAG: biotin/lipoyl-binding protein [Treponema sp.]|jgi:HlyD family secretion protein|nr:biotin/lipoyl-binding protein [Treponema sp.]